MDRVCAAPLIRGTEFEVLHDPVTNTTIRRFGTCGPRAIASALSSALGHVVALQEVYTWMRSHRDANGNPYCDESGASTLSAGKVCCAAFGAVVVDSLGYANPLSFPAFEDFVRRHAGIDPCVLETSVGQALVDSISGDGENATNLQYHFPALLVYHAGGVSDYFGDKVLPEGVGAADGDNYAGGNNSANGFNAANVLQFYPMTVLQACKPVGIYALKGRDVSLQITQVSGFFSANPDGSWHAKSSGKDVRGGILQFFQDFASPSGNLNGFSDMGIPLTGEIPSGTPKQGTTRQPTIQVFERGAYRYDPDRVVDNPPGATGAVYKAHLNAKEILELLAPASPPPPPPPAPSLSFGTPTASVAQGDGEVTLTITQTYELK